MIFDQYSRYKACSDLLRQTGFAAGNTVLDIGSGPECLFGQFVPDATITYVDPLIPNSSGQGRISGNVFANELDGQVFDCVSAVDVLEHIPLEQRHAFLTRLSSLGKNSLVLGFPTSDSSDAMVVDQAIDARYRAIFGHPYPWLEEHCRFGLPSLTETIALLNQLGWHCQSVGHGHAPWLQELLGFVVCEWNVPRFAKVVLDISEKFNRTLYPYDFCPPHYRQFLIASRSPLPPVVAPACLGGSVDDAKVVFHALMVDALHQHFDASMQYISELQRIVTEYDIVLSERDAAVVKHGAAVVERDAAVVERDTAVVERDAAVVERDAAVVERDAAVVERDAAVVFAHRISSSKSWHLTRPLRFFARVARYGFVAEDLQRLNQGLRHRYHRLPLPTSVKNLGSLGYHKVFSKGMKILRYWERRASLFRTPDIKLAAKREELPDYIVWGVIDWHFRHQRPQQLALALAETGRRVFYISPNLVDDERAGFNVEAVDTCNRLFQIKLFVKGAPSIYAAAPNLEIVNRLRASFGEVLVWADCESLTSLIQHPFWFEVASVLPNSRLVYDCMDHHAGFENTGETLARLEKELLHTAELTVTTSAWLDQAVARRTQRRALIRNAGEYAHFSKVPNSIYRDPQGRRIIGYYGAIAEWFDLDLILAVAQRFPECCVLLVGADTANASSRLGDIANILFIGEVPYNSLPYYLYSFDVCLLPFKVIPLTLATNPVKVYEYLSAGKPIVSVELPEMAQFDGLVYVVADQSQFLAAVGTVLAQPEPNDLIQRRKHFAEGQTWSHRVEELIQHAESKANDPKVSVVVVTYNNLELTQACLASIDEHSQYENLEIIVVDNASSDGSPTFLEHWVSTGANRKLILNDDNRGFASANNQGLAIATGVFLVLLNNDTFVTPGWARTLVGHLKRDKSIGLIGPVTNNIGNEAKIDIQYTNMSAMLVKSAAYTRRHIGQIYPLRTAAFFCVMIDRLTFDRVGPLDEAFGRGFFEDDDYCRRVEKLGLRTVCAEDAFIHHQLSASFNKLKQQDRQKLFEENKKIYEAKWGEWIAHGYRKNQPYTISANSIPSVFDGHQYVVGHCQVCEKPARFFYKEEALWRESLNCEHCRTTSRYRSITRGVLRAITELSGEDAQSLATLSHDSTKKLSVYDTQPPFYYETCAYPLPDLLKATGWITVALSQYKPNKPLGEVLAKGVTNQNLECLTFADGSLDIVITSDVMEHVRMDDRAHREIYRVLKPSGIYIFTVPHNRAWDQTLIRVAITDPADPAKDVHLLEPEYHGDTNSDEGTGVLAYRAYGRDIEKHLTELGFQVEYSREDIPEIGILNTELYYCRKVVA
jgi:O-antigen biosynthesis protein